MRTPFAIAAVALALAVGAGQAVAAPHYQQRAQDFVADLCRGAADIDEFPPKLRLLMEDELRNSAARCAKAGGPQRVEYIGTENGAEVYEVTFQHAATAWWLRFAPNGEITSLLFQ